MTPNGRGATKEVQVKFTFAVLPHMGLHTNANDLIILQILVRRELWHPTQKPCALQQATRREVSFHSLPGHWAKKHSGGEELFDLKAGDQLNFLVTGPVNPALFFISRHTKHTDLDSTQIQSSWSPGCIFFPHTYVSFPRGSNSREAPKITLIGAICSTDKTETYEEFEEARSAFFSQPSCAKLLHPHGTVQRDKVPGLCFVIALGYGSASSPPDEHARESHSC